MSELCVCVKRKSDGTNSIPVCAGINSILVNLCTTLATFPACTLVKCSLGIWLMSPENEIASSVRTE